MKINIKRLTLIALILVTTGVSQIWAQQVKVATVAFYNLENLFDTIDDTSINDEDFLPTGKFAWGTMKYKNKLENMAKVISQIGDPQDGSLKFNGPTFLGVSEVENRTVLEDLVAMPALKKSNYGIVHQNSPDHRGIDVAFFYKKDVFKVLSSKTFPYFDAADPERKSRDQLLVTGIFEGDTMNFIVNHWPSRAAPSPKRVIAAKICREIVDSLLTSNAKAKIYVMGDFNDTPLDASLRWLEHKTEKKKPSDDKVMLMFNPLTSVHKQGKGTIAHMDIWSVFDMILISPGAQSGTGYTYKSIQIFDRPWIYRKDSQYSGYPLRTHGGVEYLNGYSDHLPVVMFITKAAK